MTTPGLVSVLMPNRNHAHYLPRAFESWMAQTWPNFEVIVIDDCSSDNSRDVVADYHSKDPRLRLLALESHHGVNRAVVAALDEAKGEYVYVAAADDFVVNNFLARCVAELEKHPQAGLCFSDPTEFHESDQRAIHFPLFLSDQPIFYPPEMLTALLARNYFTISANTGIYRMDAFRKAGAYCDELHWFSDWFVTLVVALRHGACYLPEQLSFVTIRNDSYSARNLREAGPQRALLNEVLSHLAQPDYEDVARTMRKAGLIPEYHLRTLVWLLSNPEGRRFINPQLVRRIIGRALWSYLRPFAPVRWRRVIRRIHSERQRNA